MAAEHPTTVTLELSSPETKPVTITAREVIVPGRAGIFSVRPGHTPLISTLASGVLMAEEPSGQETFFAVHGGFAEVVEGAVRILTPQYERGDAIDAARAAEAMERAEQRLTRRSAEDDLGRAEAALMRAVARLAAHKGESL